MRISLCSVLSSRKGLQSSSSSTARCIFRCSWMIHFLVNSFPSSETDSGGQEHLHQLPLKGDPSYKQNAGVDSKCEARFIHTLLVFKAQPGRCLISDLHSFFTWSILKFDTYSFLWFSRGVQKRVQNFTFFSCKQQPHYLGPKCGL